MRRYEVLYIGRLCIVTVMCYCASVWCNVYLGFCVCNCGLVFSVRMGNVYWGVCVVTLMCCCASV